MTYPLQQITLNIRYDIPETDWKKIGEVYRSMDGWIETAEGPGWYGIEDRDAQWIRASVEPSGILFAGQMEDRLWTGWLTVLCAKLTVALGREVRDAEMASYKTESELAALSLVQLDEYIDELEFGQAYCQDEWISTHLRLARERREAASSN